MHTSVPLLIRNCHKKRVWLKTSCIYYVSIFLGQEEGPSLAGCSALGLPHEAVVKVVAGAAVLGSGSPLQVLEMIGRVQL